MKKSVINALERAFHCGVGGHDVHLEDEVKDSAWQASEDRCVLAFKVNSLSKHNEIMRKALETAKEYECESYCRSVSVWGKINHSDLCVLYSKAIRGTRWR